MCAHNIPFSIYKKKKFTLNYPKSVLWDFSKGLKNKLEIAEVNEPSAFEPMKVYCNSGLIFSLDCPYLLESIFYSQPNLMFFFPLQVMLLS